MESIFFMPDPDKISTTKENYRLISPMHKDTP
jgi:hypothetical protein